jgi:membrane protein YdbS with pleckstrin-like domain
MEPIRETSDNYSPSKLANMKTKYRILIICSLIVLFIIAVTITPDKGYLIHPESWKVIVRELSCIVFWIIFIIWITNENHEKYSKN